jgi:hypothetical protein
MAAWRYTIAPGQPITGPDPAQGRGQYWIVTAGSLTHSVENLPKMSCAFVYPEDSAFRAAAGADGAELIAMQFPLRETTH